MEQERYPLTNEVFHDRDLFAREMDQLFGGTWVYVGTDDQLPGPRSWFVYEAAGRSVIVARDKDRNLGAFVNSCTHRGTRLCAGGQGQGKIQCPYHGWVFDTDGRLLGATRRAGLPPFDDGDYGLARLSVDQVGRFIFVNRQEQPQISLRDYLGEKAATLEALSGLLVSPLFEIRMPIEGNWKLVVSGAIEDYHVPFVHGQSLDPSREKAAESTLLERGHSSFITPAPVPWWVRFFIRLLAGRDPAAHLENHLIFPNFLLVHIWVVVHVTTFVPLAPGRTVRISRLYDVSPPRFFLNPLGLLRRLLLWVGKKGVAKVYGEDQRIVEEAQKGTEAGRSLRRGPAHAEEARVEHFLAEAAARLGLSYGGEESS